MRRKMTILLFGLFSCISCTGEKPGQESPSGTDGPVPPAERVLAAPGNLTAQKTDGGILLQWEDLSNREEGYLVGKKNGSNGKSAEFFLPANTISWTDTDFHPGQTDYTVQSYWHMDRSPASSVSFTEIALPEVSFLPVEASCHMAVLGLKVLSDGGDPVTFGVTRSRDDGSDSRDISYAERLSAGDVAYLLSEDLEENVTYRFLPWAENSAGRVSGDARTARLSANPGPVTLTWEDIPAGSLPQGVALKKASTDVLGHPVNLWCVMADLSKGTVEIRTTISQTLIEPGTYIRETLSAKGRVLALTNGGYFASPAMSYSYVCDRGVKKASNVTQLTRTRGYTVTRGFWGVDASGRPAIGWQNGENCYAEPLPVYDGGPVLYPDSNLPLLQEWTPFSAIGGGPVLVKDGRYCFDYLKSLSGMYLSNHELFQSDIYASGLRAPRTAVGSNPDGLVVLLVADGRNSGGSTGLTLDELAQIMTGLGCTDVLNLDGGGSSMFLTGSEGTLQNNPSDGRQRKVLSFVSIMEKKQ